MSAAFVDSLAILFSAAGLLSLVAGTLLGVIVGALPGLGPSIGITLLIPITYGMPPELSMLLLVSLYMAAEYGGSISAILLSTPGTAAAAATAIDGYAMTRKGQASEALAVSLNASCVGGLVGVGALLLIAQPLAAVALRFSPAAYFSIALLGLTAVASLSAGSMIKGLISGALGLALAMVGLDPITGIPRFTFGVPALFEGIPFLTALIGLFALSEALRLAEDCTRQGTAAQSPTTPTPRRLLLLPGAYWRRIWRTVTSGSIIGTLLGILPGVGGSVACWISYDFAKRRAPDPETFGSGNPAGVAAPESSNNATVGGAMIPLLTLGIPGSPTTAVLMGALILHGLRPGPALFAEAPVLVSTICWGLLASVVMLFLIGTLLIPLWVVVLRLSNAMLAVGIAVLSIIGAFSLRNLMFDVYLMVGFGVLGYLARKLGFSLPAMVLAMVLGYLVETSYRQALMADHGNYLVFVQDPLSLVFLLLVAATIALPAAKHATRRWRASQSHT